VTDRVSERVWRAARAAYEGRIKAINAGAPPGQELLKVGWDEATKARRNLEYDTILAAFKAVEVEL